MKKLYKVELTEVERTELLALIGAGEAKARRLRRGRTLLLADEGHTDEAIADVLHIGHATVAEPGSASCRRAGPRPWMSGLARAGSRSSMPSSRRIWWRWPVVRRPRGRNVGHCGCWPTAWELGMVEEISYETARRGLKKTRSSARADIRYVHQAGSFPLLALATAIVDHRGVHRRVAQ